MFLYPSITNIFQLLLFFIFFCGYNQKGQVCSDESNYGKKKKEYEQMKQENILSLTLC